MNPSIARKYKSPKKAVTSQLAVKVSSSIPSIQGEINDLIKRTEDKLKKLYAAKVALQ